MNILIFSEDELFLRNKTKNLDFISQNYITKKKKLFFALKVKLIKKRLLVF